MRNQYSVSEFLDNIYSFVMTKLTMPQARFVRRPIYIRGASSMVGGKGLTTGRFCRFDLIGDKETLFVGDNCEMGDMTHIVAHESVTIGNNVLIASKCFISDTSHGIYTGANQSVPDDPPNQRKLVTKPVSIGNNVWIGENVVILFGVVIGDGCIIGANSVVTKSIESNSIVVGSPARVIKRFENKSHRWNNLLS